MNVHTWQDQCGVCGSTRFWVSRSGYKVCYGCTEGNPLAALVTLARREGSEAVVRAQIWAGDADALASTPSV